MNNSRLAGVKFYKKDKTSLVEISSNFRETLNINDYVIVKFENSSTDLAQIIFLNDENKNKAACKCGIKINATIIKRAENSDIETRKYLDESEKKAIEKCSKLIEKHNLKMFLLDAHYMIDKSKITFYFSAESRIDFRELVKELASSFKTRIELLQVGIRDECKRLGGLGICGQETCCSKFLYNFTPVSIKMAKNQMLNLTPNKISGICGRLMCCLSYENEAYASELKNYPPPNSTFEVNGSFGRIINFNILKKSVTFTINNGYTKEIPLKEFMENYGKSLKYSSYQNDDSDDYIVD